MEPLAMFFGIVIDAIFLIMRLRTRCNVTQGTKFFFCFAINSFYFSCFLFELAKVSHKFLIPFFANIAGYAKIIRFRWIFLGQGAFPGVSLLIGFGVGVITFLLGAFIFRRVERSFVDVI